ncbi:flotillin-1 [Elysia marginata]|uniref:Flotillin-1 n=1 Tax=Elysia marginata TaxID=1093978 RepID=A0AAV4HQ61_9GAST|nr:flotillin-1 [Elysia marginata]
MGFETCGPNEVLVVSGMGHSQPKFKNGGWVFVWPKLQRLQRLSVSLMTLSIETNDALTQQGIAISVKAVAQVKVCSQNMEMLKMAAERFLGKSEEEISGTVMESLQGIQKTLISKSSLEEIYFDSEKKFNKTLFEEAASELINMGIQIVSYKVVDVEDKEGHMETLIKERSQDRKKETTSSAE